MSPPEAGSNPDGGGVYWVELDIVEQLVFQCRIFCLHGRRVDRRVLFLSQYNPDIAQVVFFKKVVLQPISCRYVQVFVQRPPNATFLMKDKLQRVRSPLRGL